MVSRYRQAANSFQAANNYFNKLSMTINKKDIDHWTAEITKAESNRFDKPDVMDLMGTWHVKAAGRDVGELQNHQETSPGEEWISLALTVEERQCVLTPSTCVAGR